MTGEVTREVPLPPAGDRPEYEGNAVHTEYVTAEARTEHGTAEDSPELRTSEDRTGHGTPESQTEGQTEDRTEDRTEGRTGSRALRRVDWRKGRGVAVLSVCCAAALLAHPFVPDGAGNSGSLIETFVPWSALVVPPLLLLALLRRSGLALISVLLPVLAWLALFGGSLTDRRGSAGELMVVSHNVGAENPDPEGTARALAASGAQVIAVQELSPTAREKFQRALPPRYRHHTVQGGVGLWSTYGISAAEPLEIMPWPRALRATLATPKGPVTVFVAHLASVRVTSGSGFTTDRRDAAAGLLTDAVNRDPAADILLVGDFNGTANDRGLSPLLRGMTSAHEVAGDGFGFSWPARLPLARIDHIFARGLQPVSAQTLPATGSDHLPVLASFAF
ncbi:endonuclease/exonuclease/phosphatase family protein [Streptomyces albipurpureus]|uniref:Endonuclease/exonuclease/phosphatase family protein n=1 Tax=Streptomyces albipurpureus TaxID=2897419 RepID=A0ABT0UKE8_9ACTN|nr:endonuclease/exonuclease/phosphatase family protein [Streptomyces sp. CWNU-1]MCM2388831.1 endonuclease/exonuclease/phosphatase family protein [Streptomyces sp. CWNU-1]